jgi:hypothetical protein
MIDDCFDCTCGRVVGRPGARRDALQALIDSRALTASVVFS